MMRLLEPPEERTNFFSLASYSNIPFSVPIKICPGTEAEKQVGLPYTRNCCRVLSFFREIRNVSEPLS